MKTFRLMNVYLYLDYGNHITVEGYKIFQRNSSIFKTKHCKKHNQNAYVEFDGKQQESILFHKGIAGNRKNPKKRKLIEDILVIGSLLTGWNWCLFSRREYATFPLTPRTYLENIELKGKAKMEEAFQIALTKIKNAKWQIQYENGFHLRMLLNRANITNTESRFLSNVVIWEWLYPHLKNPNGATPDDEKGDLQVIMDYILNCFWSNRIFKGKIIFVALRNQLAHSGSLPINRQRSYVESWMTDLTWETKNGKIGINEYIHFFDKLTQIIVLKTLGINAESMCENHLNNFLSHGKLL